MAVNLYKRSVLIGGGADSLDLIDGAGLNDGDFAFVMTSSNISYTYILNATSGATESSPGIITPDTNAGSKRWILQNTSGVSAPLVNILTNSQWMAMSGSTLENVGSQLVASWANVDYDTFTSTGANITSAVYTTVGTQNADTASITIVSGKLYKIVATETHTSGDHLVLTGTGGVTTTTLAAGANTIVFEATAAATVLTVTNTAAANNSCTFTLYEVTPGYVAADNSGPDGWKKNSASYLEDIWREHSGTNTKDGSFYALKITTGAEASALTWPTGINDLSQHFKKFTGRTVTFGAWIKASNANAVRLSIQDGSNTNSAYHTGGGSFEWLEVTATISASATYFQVTIMTAVNSVTYYLSQPMLVFGSSIGQGNYAPKVGEVVSIETAVNISISGVDGTLNNMEALSSGKIGKGVKAYYGRLTGTYTAADYGFAVSPINNKNNGLYILTQRNGVITTNGRVAADINGDLYSTGDDTFTSTTLIITAIEP